MIKIEATSEATIFGLIPSIIVETPADTYNPVKMNNENTNRPYSLKYTTMPIKQSTDFQYRLDKLNKISKIV
ncbi:hypothetical protein BpHYR1_017374 [Brachionus plicatilis]|uniref:Uncharacterized protein n=1 Tax=Brachionus plicatilis TaxID=10195 RepID=A0A3M7QVC6_BRAPC|nr:hypothetical protein BpHYR1_017374 [Brachionus plicatilis]